MVTPLTHTRLYSRVANCGLWTSSIFANRKLYWNAAMLLCGYIVCAAFELKWQLQSGHKEHTAKA